MLDRCKNKPPKIFVIRDIYGREWTTKEGLYFLKGIYAVDFKKYFYRVWGETKYEVLNTQR